MSWGRSSDTRGRLDCPVPPATPKHTISHSNVCQGHHHHHPQECRFLLSGNVAAQSATFNWRTNLALYFLCPQDRSDHSARSSAADSVPQVLSHRHAKLTATLPCCTWKDGVHMQYIMAKGHMFLCNTRVGNTCNPFTLFIVLLSIHRRLWCPYLLSVPCITNTSH